MAAQLWQLFYVGLGLVSVGVALYGGVWLLRQGLRAGRWIYVTIPGSLSIKLMALGVAAVLLPLTLPQWIRAIAAFGFTLLSELVNQFTTRLDPLKQVCGGAIAAAQNTAPVMGQIVMGQITNQVAGQVSAGGSGSETLNSPAICAIAVGTHTLQAWMDALTLAAQRADLAQLPLTQTIILIGLWVLVIQLAQLLRDATVDREVFWSNAGFLALLATGLYLSIAAISAIPSLEDPPDDRVLATQVTRLEEQLTLTRQTFARQYPVPGDELDPSNNPYEQIKATNPFASLADLRNDTDVNLAPDRDVLIQDRADAWLAERNRRDQLQARAGQLLNTARRTLDNQLKTAITRYQVANTDRQGTRETAQHFLLTTAWYDSEAQRWKTILDDCLWALQAADTEWQTWSIREADIVNSVTPPLPPAQPISLPVSDRTTLNQAFNQAQSVCVPNTRLATEVSRPPDRPALGSTLGPFSVVSGWLLRTESLPLALITGTLGFGLLGSACSSFVRDNLSGHEISLRRRVLVRDLPKVAVIGLSAAILAFLFVMGGLSLFFADAQEPNAYALLSICLLAAVFGEDVWRSARENFLRKLQEATGHPPPALPPAQDDHAQDDHAADPPPDHPVQ
jgi:hypothetical protein